MRSLVLLAALVTVAAAAWWLWPADSAPNAGPDRRASQPEAPSEPARAPGAEAQRVAAEGVGTEATAGTFVSESEDDGVVSNAVRDGIVVLVLGPDRSPRANARLDVRWRKGWGNYGHDRGPTDAQGRFATTVAEYEMLEGIVLHDAEFGDVGSWCDFLPMNNEPRTVLVVVPRLEPLTIRVVDQRGNAIAGANVTVEGGAADAVPREHTLRPALEDAKTGADGRVALRLLPCAHTFKAAAEQYLTMYTLRAEVSRGRTLTLHLLDRRALHDVAVTVLPDDAPKGLYFFAWARELPPDLPGIEATGIEPVQMEFAFRNTSPREFVVQAPPLRWRCSARHGGSYGGVEVGAFDTRATIELKAAPARPMARLKCTLLLPDGQRTFGEITVHRTPDLDGSRESVSQRDAIVAVEPGGKACVSAWVYRYPPVVVGPIELTEGEHELTFQFVAPLSIRGRAIDERGEPARVTVNLLRPAGALRALAADVPAMLPSAATGDSLGTGDQGEGRFWFETVGVGEHELYVRPEGLGWPARVRVTPGDQDVVVRLGTGIDDLARVQGRVTMSGTNAPVAGAQIRWIGDHTHGSSYTDIDGRYTLVVAPGRVHAEVWARRCAALLGDDESLAAGLVTRDFALAASEPLFVRVLDADGKVPDVEVLGRDDKGREMVFLDANGNSDGECIDVGSSGRVVLRGLPVTKFTIIVRETGDDDAKNATQVVEVPANTPRDVEFAIRWNPARKDTK